MTDPAIEPMPRSSERLARIEDRAQELLDLIVRANDTAKLDPQIIMRAADLVMLIRKARLPLTAAEESAYFKQSVRER